MSSPDQFPPEPPAFTALPVVIPAPLRVKRRLKRIAPLTLGTISALMYGAMGLIFLPFLLLFAAIGSQAPGAAGVGAVAFGMGFAIAAPLMYAAMGFIIGIIGAALYNLFAKWTGGIEVEVE